MKYTAPGVRHALVIAALSLALAAPVSAKPQMTDSRDAVAHKLNEMGFVSWKRLTRHHRFWRVKDARRDNGKTYDLKLERGSLEVMKLKRDRHRFRRHPAKERPKRRVRTALSKAGARREHR